jgi:hypothetical protein
VKEKDNAKNVWFEKIVNHQSEVSSMFYKSWPLKFLEFQVSAKLYLLTFF